jgi:hypothetical protein
LQVFKLRHLALIGLALGLAAVVMVVAFGASSERTGPAPRPDAHELASADLKPRVIDLHLPADLGRAGGLLVADLDRDGARDVLVSQPGHLAAYRASGETLWQLETDIQLTGQAESEGLPGLHAPGVTAAEIDGDGRVEVLYLTRSGALVVLDGASGQREHRVDLEAPAGAERWEHLVVADFRGLGDRDLLLQATNRDGYRMGRHLAAFALDRLLTEGPEAARLWQRDDFQALAHGGARIADLDGDGRHEVLGGDLLGPDGKRRLRLDVDGHIDAIVAADVRPDLPGLEVVALEEGSRNRIFLYGPDRLYWVTHDRHQEPQNAVVGDFDPDRPGLEIWCRSRYDTHQRPFVFDAHGRPIASYPLAERAPAGWTNKGVEVIAPIDWRGGTSRLAAAKERHRAGDVGVFDPLTGRFVRRIEEQADRLYVADVFGDGREELVVRSGSRVRIYANPEPAAGPVGSPWRLDHYRRSKLTWNYYSP